MIKPGDGVRDARQQERLRSEDADVRDDPALAHHCDLQHQDKRSHQSDHAVTELWVVEQRGHIQKRKVEIKAKAPRMNPTASSSGTRNKRILALVVSIK